VNRATLALWAAAAVVAAGLPLTADEAYYLEWSTALAWGYFDHPPGVALWVAFGLGHPRLPALLAFPLTLRLFESAAAAWGVPAHRRFPLLVLGTPIGFAGLCFATPDTPLVPLTAALLWALGRRRFGAAGALLGVAALVKSTALLWLPGVLLLAKGNRLAVAAAVVVVTMPHLGWSLAHDGLPYTFQAGRVGQGFHLPEAVLGQWLLVTPGLAFLATRAVIAKARSGTSEDRALALLAGSQLSVWAALACTTRLEANWPAFAWVPALILLARHPSVALDRAQRLAVGLTGAAAVGAMALAVWAPASWGPPRDPQALSACVPPEMQPVAARYQEKALLAAAGRDVPYLPAPGGRRSEYDTRSHPVRPACGFVYLGPPAALGSACPGPVSPQVVCGRPAAFCGCPGDLAP
jgi:hypothetical protein